MTEPNTRVEIDRSHLLLSAAWMAVVLGAVMQVLAVLAAGSPSLAALATETVQKVSWSTLVCTGLAIGATAARSRPIWTGLAGLIAAPTAFLVARTLQKSLAQALSVTAGGPPMDLVILVMAKAIEYGLFGVAIAWLLQRRSSAIACAAIGLLFGVAMAGFVLLYGQSHPPVVAPAAAVVVARSINEIVFPVGCALVLYASDHVGRRMSA